MVVVCVGIYLSSQAASSQVFSAQVSLTSVFGMGTGGPSPPSTPTRVVSLSVRNDMYYNTGSIKSQALFSFFLKIYFLSVLCPNLTCYIHYNNSVGLLQALIFFDFQFL